MLGCPPVVQDIAVPHLRVTIKIASHVMKGWQAIHLLVEAADGIVAIVGVDVHEVDCIPCWVQREDQDVVVIDNVMPESRAQTGEVVMDIGHNLRGSPPYHGPYNVQPIRVLRHTNDIVPMRVHHQDCLTDHLPGWLLHKNYIVRVLKSL
jgi:hypothetical protein